MKKILLTVIILSTFTMCKKSDLQNASRTIETVDSIAGNASQTLEKMDSEASSVLDSVNLKAKDLIKSKEQIEEAFDKSKAKIDSISENVEKFKKDIEDKKVVTTIDSIKDKIKKGIPKAKTVTKVIYKEKPVKKESVAPTNAMIKNGSVEINVDDISISKQSLKEIIRKYDGIINTENLVSNDEFQTFYITAKIPFEKFDYLVEDLSVLGNVHNKNLEVKGSSYYPKQLCNLDITLYQNHIKNEKPDADKSFAPQSLEAISTGWRVIGDILIFLLPFWPVFLISGIGYYFYKKKYSRKNNSDQNP